MGCRERWRELKDYITCITEGLIRSFLTFFVDCKNLPYTFCLGRKIVGKSEAKENRKREREE